MIIIDEIVKTCDSCPAQWEGRTREGGWVYVRYRWGGLQIGVGPTLKDAVRDASISLTLGDSLDGYLSYEALKAATKDHVSWPTV